MKTINTVWANRMKEKTHLDPNHINEIVSFNAAAQWLIALLANQNIPFRIYNLGAGVKRITTEVDTCPCCKRKLED